MYRHIYSLRLIVEKDGKRDGSWHVSLDKNGNDIRGNIDPSPKRRVVDLRAGDYFIHFGKRERVYGIECHSQHVISDEEAAKRMASESIDGWLVKCADDYRRPYDGMGGQREPHTPGAGFV